MLSLDKQGMLHMKFTYVSPSKKELNGLLGIANSLCFRSDWKGIKVFCHFHNFDYYIILALYDVSECTRNLLDCLFMLKINITFRK